MTDITPKRLQTFREKLRKELLEGGTWYHPTKEKNQDVYVFHPGSKCPDIKGKAGKVAEHRYVWWLHHPDEPIEYNEMIHHINGNHKDNRIENLEKIKAKQHGLRHKAMRDNTSISISAIHQKPEVPEKEAVP